jgi:uncharacterized membrane protein YoaT (DUF817 family)
MHYRLRFFFEELWAFGWKEARAALFPGIFLALIFVSTYVTFFGLYRYDFLFLAAVLVQVLMVYFKLETKDEAKVILLFHAIGMMLELYKTHPSIGSWSYPEEGYFKLLYVPLFSGFMYASIGSYIAASWKVLKLRMIHAPKYILSVLLCGAIYINFFTNHYVYDIRYILIASVCALYAKTWIAFTPRNVEYRMPLVAGFVGIAGFVWIAENIGTFYGAWLYPSQIHAWSVVSLHKITSWFLMVIISFIIVAYLKYVKASRVS